jgi:hypothetical protein
VGEGLVALGAPLAAYAPRAQKSAEEVLVDALALSHSQATFLRVLPFVLVRNRAKLDLGALAARATARGVAAELGMLFELTARIGAVAELLAHAERLKSFRSQGLRYYFGESGPFQRRLAEQRSPDFAKNWGFFLNMSEELFSDVLKTHGE